MNLQLNHIIHLKTVFFIFILLSFIASTQSFFLKEKTFGNNPTPYTHYNNYKIFKHSFFHLVQEKDLYAEYPQEHYDYYKYSPTFALFYGFFAILPDFVGLNAWNALNALLLLFAMYYLPRYISEKKIAIILLLCALELLTSLQNEQSNGIMAGLFILSFALLERDNYFWAAFCLVGSVYIKIFGLVAFALLIFYPKKLKTMAYLVFWSILLFILPLLVLKPNQLLDLYKSWGNLLQADHSASYGYSVMGWIQSWFGLGNIKNEVLIIGFILVLLPFLSFKLFANKEFRLLSLCSLLIWSVIFNHKAESPTFIIAWAGITLWFIQTPKTIVTWSLFVFAFIFTCLSPTDLFPKIIKEMYVIPYNLKVFPCILVWVKINYDLLIMQNESNLNHIQHAIGTNSRI